MKLFTIFISKAHNKKYYPSRFSRFLFSLLVSLTVLDFDSIATGKNFAENNYWLGKGLTTFLTFLVLEYIYQIHIWCTKHYGIEANNLKVGIHQFFLGVVAPRILIWQITGLFGITYGNFWEGHLSQGKISVALINETLVIFNIILFLCYLIVTPRLKNTKYKNNLPILVWQHEILMQVNLNEVLCIIDMVGTNVLITKTMAYYNPLINDSLREFFKTLPNDQFELRNKGIFQKGVSSIEEEAIEDYVFFVLSEHIRHFRK
ncbi:hypothetical protein [Pedobacter jeongneungensis]|uniref:hypothetical protein n=1 Tax=Pedobacter jeongneungensis TaxID=947309 RepID=UPI000469F68F|nr:hypothetical protein [Pedobacter jeongneungensis]